MLYMLFIHRVCIYIYLHVFILIKKLASRCLTPPRKAECIPKLQRGSRAPAVVRSAGGAAWGSNGCCCWAIEDPSSPGSCAPGGENNQDPVMGV